MSSGYSYPPILESYKRWWLGKYCRLVGSHGEFKYVMDVKFTGPPSGVYGSAELVYHDRSKQIIPCGNAFKPRKKDVEVWPGDGPPPPYKESLF